MLVFRPSHRLLRLVPITGLLCLAGGVHMAVAREIDGFTEPYRDIDVAAPEMGQIDRLEVREGDRVKAGQVLARLDDEVWKASLEVARAAMESAGRVEAAEAELRLCQETLGQTHRPSRTRSCHATRSGPRHRST